MIQGNEKRERKAMNEGKTTKWILLRRKHERRTLTEDYRRVNDLRRKKSNTLVIFFFSPF